MEEGDILKARRELEKLLDPQMIQVIKQAIPDNSLAEPLLKLTSLRNKCNKLRQQIEAIEGILDLETNKLGEPISLEMILYYITTACEHAKNGISIGGTISTEKKSDDGREI